MNACAHTITHSHAQHTNYSIHMVCTYVHQQWQRTVWNSTNIKIIYGICWSFESCHDERPLKCVDRWIDEWANNKHWISIVFSCSMFNHLVLLPAITVSFFVVFYLFLSPHRNGVWRGKMRKYNDKIAQEPFKIHWSIFRYNFMCAHPYSMLVCIRCANGGFFFFVSLSRTQSLFECLRLFVYLNCVNVR